MLGAANPNGLYVPMSPTEMETLSRLWETGSYVLRESTFGELPILDVIIGDKRLALDFQLGPDCFEPFEAPTPVRALDLTLSALDRLLISKKLLISIEGNPLLVCKGVHHVLRFDIAIDKINPELIREVIPKLQGLTSRIGNTKHTSHEMRLIQSIEKGKQLIREHDRKMMQKYLGK